jgi:large subunit ribosomal protein L10
MSTKAERQATVDMLADRLGTSPNIYVTDFTGLDVGKMTTLRRRLREAGAGFVVVKNTLARRALASRQISAFDDQLTGPVGLVLAGADPLPAAKVIGDFAREFAKPTVKVGLVDGKAVEAAYVARLGTLPSREVLLAQVAGSLNGILYQMVSVLEALREQRQAES